MDHEALKRRVQYLILAELAEGDRLGRDGVVRAVSLAEQVLATARGLTPVELLRDALERLAAARAEWSRSADDPDGFGAAALDELARGLASLAAQLQSE